jgi:ribonuclease P protein component
VGLPKQHRLRSRHDFQRVYQKGRCWKGQHLILRCLYKLPASPASTAENAEPIQGSPRFSGATKFGISVSQKVSKKAVVRNRLKRQVRAVIRSFLPKILPDWLVVISLKASASGCNYYDFLRELEELLAKAEVIDGHS